MLYSNHKTTITGSEVDKTPIVVRAVFDAEAVFTMKTFVRNLCIGMVAGGVLAMPAVAQTSTNRVNAKTDWSVYVEPAGATKPTECWIVSAPQKAEIFENGKKVSANRGDILLWVTFKPSQGIRGEISFTGGYPFKSASPVKIQIGSASYSMFVEGEYAWPKNSSDDSKIRESMKRGATAVLSGTSSRGKTTKDTFSLKGFTAALEDAQKRCS